MNPGNPLVLHFVSGASLFSGSGILLLIVALAGRLRRGWRQSVRDFLAILGGAMVFLAGTPGPQGLVWILTCGVFAWIVFERMRRTWAARTSLFGRGLLVVLALTVVGLEVPFRFMPALPQGMHEGIVVLGDSISAGIVKDKCWPQAFAQRHSVPALNLARNGATAATALEQQAKDIPPDADLVVIEIGGNDMLGGTTAAQFGKDLDKLLAFVMRPGRTVVMFELPLPPTFEEFGRVQRGLARKYGVVLVPKSYFCKVLAVPGGSEDGLHLSAVGMDAMADIMYELLAEHLKPPATQPHAER